MQTSVKPLAPEPPLPNAPYVGLRPYEASDRVIFYGRERDSRLLTDSILSTRLTLFYGQSGLGKSSLLRALVIPKLENEDVRVVYFDAWMGENPTRDLKHALAQAADEIGIPDAARGAPTLTELVRLLSSTDGKTLVLVLDQFEQFLTHHAERLDPLGKELGALVRGEGLDAHVLISLREEFLASLEPLRGSILSLFKSTCRLKPLDDEGVRSAIAEPPRAFGVEMEPELVERLIADLGEPVEQSIESQPIGRGLKEPRTAGVERSVDLPMLQLVCGRLWDEAVKMPEPRLTVALYERLGGARKIVKHYVQGVMPSERGDRLLMAELLKFLAPPSGLKTSYAGSDLAALSGLDQASTEAQLERLARARILHTREVGGRLCYELQHDAFIRVLRPWLKSVNRERRKRKNMRRVGIAALVALLVVGSIALTIYLQRRAFVRAQTTAKLESLHEEAESPQQVGLVFNDVFGFLLSADPEGKRDEELAELLNEYESELPEGYGIDEFEIEFVRFPRDWWSYWPLELHHEKDRKISRQHFQLRWNHLVQELADRWGLPLPRAVRLKPRGLLAKDALILCAPNLDKDEYGCTDEFEAAALEAWPYIVEADLTDRAELFLKRFAVDKPGPWGPIPYLEEKSRSVPRWSLPVWAATGSLADDGATALAKLVASRILANPRLVLKPQIVNRLLEHVAVDQPMVVREARSARGDDISSDLSQLVMRGVSIKHLGAILDELANHPAGKPAAVASRVDRALKEKIAPIATRARGRWDNLEKRQAPDIGVAQPTEKALAKLMDAYEEGLYRVSRRQLPIRIYLGANAETEVMQDRRTTDEVQNAVSMARSAFTEKHGFRFPLVRLYAHDEVDSGDLAPDQFRIEVVAESAADPGAVPMTFEAKSALDAILQALENRTKGFRTHWLQSDEVARLRKKQLSAPTQIWIDERYSLTDLKHLLRWVVAPSANRLESPGTTLAHLDWLLQSLVFWAEVEDIHDLVSLGGRLRDTQSARLSPQDSTPTGGAAREVDTGIRELSAGDLGPASAAFKRAVRQDREAAIAAFLKSYPRGLESSLRAQYQAKCGYTNPSQGWWELYPSLTLENQVEFAVYARGAKDAAFGRSLRVCTIDSMRGSHHALERRQLTATLLAADSDFSSWPPDESGALAKRLLIENGPGDARTMAEALLVAAITQWPLVAAESAFLEIAEHECGTDPDEGMKECTGLLQKLAAVYVAKIFRTTGHVY